MEKAPFTDITASAHGEVYDLPHKDKFTQFGWRCMTNETGYKSGTLIGNWNEERYDVQHVVKTAPIPSQYSHYFETTHKADFRNTAVQPKTNGKLPDSVRLVGAFAGEPRTFPGHQPELDPTVYKSTYKNLQTVSMETYKDPQRQK